MTELLPRVSILMPCYNAAETIEDALESLAGQTLEDFEVLAVDDGSSDATREILHQWERDDPRFQFLPSPHQGIVAALNLGLQRCRAGLVARMDADDRAHPLRLERQVSYMDSHPETAVLGCRVSAFPQCEVREGLHLYLEWQNALLSDADIRREIFIESPIAHPSAMLRRAWLDQVAGYQDHGWAEDYDLWLRLYLAGARFAKLPEELVAWRERPDRLTRVDSRYSLENFLRLKAQYLALGPCAGRDAVIVWGAGMMGRRLSKHLLRKDLNLVCFVDIDPRKIGRQRRGLPIIPPDDLIDWWGAYAAPVLLAAVGARGARPLIRDRLVEEDLLEGQDWWFVA